MEFLEFLKKLTELKLPQTTSEFEEELPEYLYSIWKTFDPEAIDFNLDLDKHRWYEIATNVYQVGDIYFGVRGATQMYSESSSWDDLCVVWEVFQMKAVETITYEPM